MILFGNLQSKSNSRMLVTNPKTKKPIFIKSAKARKTFNDMALQANAQWNKPPLEGPVSLMATIYYQSRRSDLDESLLMDLLEGVCYLNDRQIEHKNIWKKFDKDNPRVEVEVVEYEK